MIETKKVSTLLTLLVLLEYSDEKHFLTYPEISRLISENYNIEIGRKCIADNINNLIELNFDINRGKRTGVAIFDRGITLGELEILLQSLQVDNNISMKEFRSIFTYLTKDQSRYHKKSLNKKFPKKDEITSDNKEIFLNVETIIDAINLKRRVAFDIREEASSKRAIELVPTNLVFDNGEALLLSDHKNNKDVYGFYVKDIRNITFLKDSPENSEKDIFINRSLKDIRVIKKRLLIYDPHTFQIELDITDQQVVSELNELYKSKIESIEKVDDKHWTALLTASENNILDFIVKHTSKILVKSPLSLINKLKEIYSHLAKYN